MTSQINPNYPVAGNPTTASVRANFATAQQEITTLQNNTQGAPFLPLAGGQMQGPISLHNDPTSPMQPVTLGYFQANGGGGGSGPSGVPEAPADGTLYGRQDGAWLHAVNTAELDAAVSAAPFVPIAGATMTGLLILSGDPTTALGASTKQYADNNFLKLSGGTLTGPLIQAADPVNPLGTATKQYIDNQHFMPQLGPSSMTVAVVDSTSGSNRAPAITGCLTPYNANSDALVMQPRRYTVPTGASNVYADGPFVAVYGPSAGSPNTAVIGTGNQTAGYASWIFGADGSLQTPTPSTAKHYINSGKLISTNSGNSPSITCWDKSSGAAGMWFSAGQLCLGALDANGVPTLTYAWFNSSAPSLTVGTGSYPLQVYVAQGNIGQMQTTVANTRTWAVGTKANGWFGITDSTGNTDRVQWDMTGNMSVIGRGISYPATAYGSGNSIGFGWGTIAGFTNLVAVSIDNGGGSYPLASASDERIKHDIAPSTYDCLATVLELPLVEYRWSSVADPWNLGARRKRKDAPLKRVGMIAQQVNKIFPEGVMPGDNFRDHLGLVWTLDQNNMLALLVGALQQLTARVAALEPTATRH